MNEEERRRQEEDRQRQMDFILNQQAQFAADIQASRELQAQTEAAQKRTEESLNRTVEFLNRLTEVTLNGFEQVQKNIDALAAKQAETDERLNRLISAQAETDERLNKMIIVVERHISEGYHGRSRTE